MQLKRKTIFLISFMEILSVKNGAMEEQGINEVESFIYDKQPNHNKLEIMKILLTERRWISDLAVQRCLKPVRVASFAIELDLLYSLTTSTSIVRKMIRRPGDRK